MVFGAPSRVFNGFSMVFGAQVLRFSVLATPGLDWSSSARFRGRMRSCRARQP